MADHPSCDYCGETMYPTEAERRDNRKTTRRSFCDRECAGKARRKRPGPKPCDHCGEMFGHDFPKSKLEKRQFCSDECHYESKRVTLECGNCGSEFSRPQGEVDDDADNYFCSAECRLQHAPKRMIRTCPTCGEDFATDPSTDSTYCSHECMREHYKERMKGENNPNYGNRHEDMWTMPAEMRKDLSEARMGENNPNWVDGSPRNGQWRFQTQVYNWAEQHLGTECTLCGEEDLNVHHVVPRRFFEEIPMAHFASNLVPLCRSCHARVDHKVRDLLVEDRAREIPFADRLPGPILDQLKMDGSVSRVPPAVDYSPLGNVAGQVIPSGAFDKDA
jgi:hypothetical protein